MSKTPKLRFKEFSGDWEVKKLGNICEVTMGNLHHLHAIMRKI